MKLQLLPLVFCASLMASVDLQAGSVEPVDLRCEYHVDPQGIDVLQPRLFWRLDAVKPSQRGLRQRAYRVLVASNADALAANRGDLWDSTRIVSDKTTRIVYQGKPLRSEQPCYWKVKVWDQDGSPSDWSPTAEWSMGLLSPDDWQAAWIGLDAPALQENVLQNAQWIWFPEKDPQADAPIGTRFFRREIDLPTNTVITKATMYVAADNRFNLFVNGNEAKSGAGFSAAEAIDLTHRLRAGRNLLALSVANEGESANPAGLLGSLCVETSNGRSLKITTDEDWRSCNVERPKWSAVDYVDADWKPARVVGTVGCAPWGKVAASSKIYRPSPMLRRDFHVNKEVRRVMVYATSLGVYQLRLNGRRVGEDYLTPGWTDYNKRLYYNAYDVTSLVRPGDNTIGGILADGWYAGNLSILGQFRYGKNLRLRAQLTIEYQDGDRQTIATDADWQGTLDGPIRRSDMQDGETYDARQELTGWDSPGFEATGWRRVQTGKAYEGVLQAYPGDTLHAFESIKPIGRSEPKPGVFVYDMGQNFAGWAQLRVQAPAGAKVVLRFAEMLNADGTIYTENLRSARCTDEYVAKGDGIEIWEPSFSFHGFRYVELTGLPEKPQLDAVTGIAATSPRRETGDFQCSNPMLNRLYENIVWGQRSNYFEVPTDCPQRDERLGWTGDTQVFIRTGCYNQDVAAFFTKWLQDLEDSQREDGAFGNQAPELHGHGSPGWADAGIICPWTFWQVYGDTRVIEKHYDAMARWIDHMQRKSEGMLRPAIGYGDWLSLGEDTPKDLIATAYFAYTVKLMSEMADAIGRAKDAEKYEELHRSIRTAFIRAYVNREGHVQGETQTAYLMALRFGLMPEDMQEAATTHLVKAIEAENWHLSTGFLGVNLLLPTLEQVGRSDVAYRLLQNTTYPSWGYSVVNGATTIWERWNSYTIKDGFGDAGMNSFNHYAYGSAGQWMLSAVAGIDAESPGFRSIRIRPRISDDLDYAQGHYDSIQGRIQTRWRRDNGGTRLSVRVPPNTHATVHVPASAPEIVHEGGVVASESPGVSLLRTESGQVMYRVGSGEYEFSWP